MLVIIAAVGWVQCCRVGWALRVVQLLLAALIAFEQMLIVWLCNFHIIGGYVELFVSPPIYQSINISKRFIKLY